MNEDKEGAIPHDGVYVTIDHIHDHRCLNDLRVNDELSLRKDHDDPYDDEAFRAYDLKGRKCGYVANSVSSVARGTYSAGRLYDLVGEEAGCRICFILDDIVIAKVLL